MPNRPLDWMSAVRNADWPAAAEAGQLLRGLGADVRSVPGPEPALDSDGVTVGAAPASLRQDWFDTTAALVTGRPDGPALISAGRPATVARAALLAIELITAQRGERTRLDGRDVLGERATLTGWAKAGTSSAGGAARLLRCADGWWVLNLPRESDLELVPALVEADVSGGPWPAIERWARARPARAVVERAATLGLATGLLPAAVTPPEEPWSITDQPASSIDRRSAAPRVVNLGALWAGPLCANLLRLAGAEVVDVESATRPDGARFGSAAFYQLLHEGNASRQLDFRSADGRRELRELVASADIVIEASRPRALRQLGVAPADILADGRPRTWIQITGHGPAEPNRVAFGDDAAVAGGLVAWDEAGPVFAGDALADPLTGVLAALVATACWTSPRTTLAQLCMRDVAAYCAGQSRPLIHR